MFLSWAMKIKTNNQQIIKDKGVNGKIITSKAHAKSSTLTKKLLIRGENSKQFEVFRAKILGEILTQTEIENILCEKFISSAWKLQRAMEIEKNLLDQQNTVKDFDDPDSWGTKRKRIRNIKKIRLYNEEVQHIIQYQLDLEKLMHKSLERLRNEQALRNSKMTIKPQEEVL